LDDIPKGQFICTYTGHLITEEESDIRAIETGDEYFAELDFVECLKKLKEGFCRSDENDQEDDSDSDDSSSNSNLKSSEPKKKKSLNKRDKINQQRTLSKKNPITSITSQNTETEIIFLDSDEDEQGNLFHLGFLKSCIKISFMQF